MGVIPFWYFGVCIRTSGPVAPFLAPAQMCFHPVKRKSRLKPARFLFGELCGCKNAAIVLAFGASKQAI
jgi:hypothetical protein